MPSSVRTLRRTSSLPPVLPSSMSRESELGVTPCVFFGHRPQGPAAFVSSFTRPGEDEPAYPGTPDSVLASQPEPTTPSMVHKTPEKPPHHSPVRAEPRPQGWVGGEKAGRGR